MKKLITLLLLFTLVAFLSGNQVVITNDYEYIVSEGKTYNFSNGNESNNVKYDRTNKIQIQNNKVLADPLKYHYAFFWDEADSFIGYYKTNKGITTSGSYLGQVNTQSIPLPLNAYSFALVRYDNDYVLVNGFTIEELFIDNNLAYVDPDDFNDIPIAELNGLTLNEVFDDGNLITNYDFSDGTTGWNTAQATNTVSNGILSNTITGTGSDGFLRLNNIYTISNKYYTLYRARVTNNDALTLRLNDGFTTKETIATPTINVWFSISGVFVAVNEFSTLSHRYVDNATALDKIMEVNYAYIIDLTDLGLTSLTKSQLDTYFSIYQNEVNATYYATDGNVSSVDGYYYASGKNLFNKNNVILNNNIVVSTGQLTPLSTRDVIDYIYVKENTSYIGSGTYTQVLIAYYDNTQSFISATVTSNKSFTTPADTAYVRFSINNTVALDYDTIQLEQSGTATAYEAFATPTTTLNLTFLFGVGNEPDKATMDGYYAEYEEYLEYLYVCCNIFATQTISFETIYFDDGVSTEIEQLGSILIFTLIGFTLMIFGFASKRRIFNLLSIGAFIVLGVLLAEFAGFLIIVFGLVVLNLYYTFLGDI